MVFALPEDFHSIVHRAAGRAEVHRAVREIYQGIDDATARRRPRCDASGRCCRFEEFGHNLFVTTMELALFTHELATRPDPGWNGTGCPFQTEKLCSVHAIRPFGCRVYFCDSSSAGWQQEQYERYHETLKGSHLTLGVPYYYAEWRQALAAVGLAELSQSQSGFDSAAGNGKLIVLNQVTGTQASQQEGAL